ncbi:unnamed protein product [Symbiodinium natans]|uniref:Uncharacterized protein n=1 Tax=Symbiodinium natans TaxID=878477 RepID=A0A812Q6S1_9DINO|nr:unnamed protein product [Symbiodinium natans]
MDLTSLTAAEEGTVEILEWTWPPEALGQESFRCLSYVIMKRPSGFLLCVPEGFLSAEELESGMQAVEAESIGPSMTFVAPPIQLTESGEWVPPQEVEMVPVLVVDLGVQVTESLAPADLTHPDVIAFREGDSSIFPLASEVVRLAKEWLAASDVMPGDRSGYQTAVSAVEEALPAPAKAKAPKAKRPTVQQLAAQQARMMELMASVVNRLDALGPGGEPHAPAQPSPVVPQAALPHAALQAPVSAVLPPFQAQPKGLAAVLGPPPPVRAQPTASKEQKDLDLLLNPEGTLPTPEGQASGSLTSAVLAQSQALVALVGQLSAGASDPLLEAQPGQASSVRGSIGRAKLQQELSARTGSFATKVRENMERRMDPTGLLPTEQVSFMRYLERHGGFAAQPLLGLIAWQVAQALDLLRLGSQEGARDVLSLLLVMLDQCAQDQGESSLAWLLTLQSDPPLGIFQPPAQLPGSTLQTFSPLADQRWITVSLAYVKELETIAARKVEASPTKTQPAMRQLPKQPSIPLPHAPGSSDNPDGHLSKKQQRAAQWAAAKKAASAANPKK